MVGARRLCNMNDEILEFSSGVAAGAHNKYLVYHLMMLSRLLLASVQTISERPSPGHGSIALLTIGDRKNLRSLVNRAQFTE